MMMGYKNNYGIALLLLALIIVSGCNKKSIDGEDDNLPFPTQKVDSLTVPLRIGTGTSAMNFQYNNRKHLVKVLYGNGNSLVLRLKANQQPREIENYVGNSVVSFSDYLYNPAGHPVKINHYLRNGSRDEYAGFSTLMYDSLSNLISIARFDGKQQLQSETSMTYDVLGNLRVYKNTLGPLTKTYTYDSKNGMFKNVLNTNYFLMESSNELFLSTLNNLKEVSSSLGASERRNFEYDYTAGDFPRSLRLFENGNVKSTQQVSYQ